MSRTFLFLAAVLLTAAAPAQDERTKLKQSMKQRYPTLLALQNQAKVGETHAGFAELVRKEFEKDKVDPDDPKSKTVGQVVQEENQDRRKLYALLAEDLDLTPEEVAQQNAVRNFAKAKPEHWLKLQKGRWVKKKDLPE